MAGKICMSKKSVISEHEQLVKKLRTGSKEVQKREATEQAKELAGYRKAKARTSRGTSRK